MSEITFQSLLLMLSAISLAMSIGSLYLAQKKLVELWKEMSTFLCSLRSRMDNSITCERHEVDIRRGVSDIPTSRYG